MLESLALDQSMLIAAHTLAHQWILWIGDNEAGFWSEAFDVRFLRNFLQLPLFEIQLFLSFDGRFLLRCKKGKDSHC